MEEKKTYIAFLRGINVGGHHKVPMADLRSLLLKLNYENIQTLLNSGNIIFRTVKKEIEEVEGEISNLLEKAFGFPIPTIVLNFDMIEAYLKNNPFEGIELTKDTRFYVTFLRNVTLPPFELPWNSEDGSFRILEMRDRSIFSVLDLSVTKTPKAMEILEKTFGKDVTTRNWNTILKIEQRLS